MRHNISYVIHGGRVNLARHKPPSCCAHTVAIEYPDECLYGKGTQPENLGDSRAREMKLAYQKDWSVNRSDVRYNVTYRQRGTSCTKLRLDGRCRLHVLRAPRHEHRRIFFCESSLLLCMRRCCHKSELDKLQIHGEGAAKRQNGVENTSLTLFRNSRQHR